MNDTHHVVDDADCFAHGRGLETHILHALKKILCSNWALDLVEIKLFDLLGSLWHLLGLDKDCGLSSGRGRIILLLCHGGQLVRGDRVAESDCSIANGLFGYLQIQGAKVEETSKDRN